MCPFLNLVGFTGLEVFARFCDLLSFLRDGSFVCFPSTTLLRCLFGTLSLSTIKIPLVGRCGALFLVGSSLSLGSFSLFYVLPSWRFRLYDWYRLLTVLLIVLYVVIVLLFLSFWPFLFLMEYIIAWEYDVLIRQTVEDHWDPVNLSSSLKLIPCPDYLMRFPFIVRGEDPAFVQMKADGKGYCIWGIARIGILHTGYI
jgi:hypothetical protein